MENVRKNFINRFFPVMMQTMIEKNWTTPEIELLGDAQELIKNVDVDGAGDSFFPNNLASS